VVDTDPAILHALEILHHHPDLVARYNACLTIVPYQNRSPLVGAMLVESMTDADWGIRQNATWAVGQLGLTERLPALLDRITANDEDEQVRYVAALAVVNILGDAAPATLNPLTQHPEEAVRRVALAACHAVTYAV
jgi:hypothetical protein